MPSVETLRELVRRFGADQPLPAKIGQTPLRVFLQAFHGDRGRYTDTLQAQAIGCGSFPATNGDVAAQLGRRLDERNPPVVSVKRDPRERLNELAHLAIDGKSLPDTVDNTPIDDWLTTMTRDQSEFTGKAFVSRLGCLPRGALVSKVARALQSHLQANRPKVRQ